MKIAFLVSEVSPYAKTGGLADVGGALPRSLSRLGTDIAVFLPFYREVKAKGLRLIKVLDSRSLPWKGGFEKFSVWADPATSYPICFVEHDRYFDRDGLYGTHGSDHPDNGERFGFFCRAVLEALKALPFEADVVHAHDWQTALALAYLKHTLSQDPFYGRMRGLFTIHNLAYQGIFPASILPLLGLPEALYHPEEMEFWGRINFLKAGILYASALTTVSPRYAREIQTPEYGCGLDGLLRARREVLEGILNGIDADAWNPASDGAIAAAYDAADPSGKTACKKDLLETMGLPAPPRDIPVVGLVSRLAEQKGLDILLDALNGLFALGLKLVVLGTGDPRIEARLAAARERYPSFFGLHIAFDEILARKIFSGSDMLLVPSRYEPCGLTQMYALRYGTAPIVRATGGLDDSVEEFDPAAGTGNGFKFVEPSVEALMGAVKRALKFYGRKAAWDILVRNDLQSEMSWDRAARRYAEVYRGIAPAAAGEESSSGF